VAGTHHGRRIALLAATVLLAGCGGDDSDPPTTTASAPPPERADEPAPKPQTGDGTGGVKLTEIGSFEQPLYVTQPPQGDDALYVVEQAGRVMRVPAEGEPEVFLDLSGEVSCCGEQGLFSIAFAPDHRRSGLLYASFTNADGDSRVVEYRRAESGDMVDPGSAREILAIDQPYPNHNGGLVAFGPDDELYAGFGDGGSGGDPDRNAQNPSTPLGKLLRLDPKGSNRYLIVALGLRNPWRFSFDRATDDLWIGDVGQSSLEEIDSVRFASLGDGPLNFGWSAFEGTEPFNAHQEAQGHIPPVLTYGRDRGCSVTGGYVVRDPRLESLYGRYLYGDYCEGELRSFPARAGRQARGDVALGPRVPGLSSFGEDSAGRLYATSIEGAVYRLDPSG
jgi:glucose/arabinose dehydrogenase